MAATPLKSREAIEAAAAVLRSGRMPPKSIVEPIVQRLDAIALALMLGNMRATSLSDTTNPQHTEEVRP